MLAKGNTYFLNTRRGVLHTPLLTFATTVGKGVCNTPLQGVYPPPPQSPANH